MLGQSAAASTIPTQRDIPYFIPLDGLLYYYDAGVQASYPGSGNRWTNLVDTTVTASLVNVTFNTGSGGNLVFDGSTSYINFGNSTLYDAGSGPISLYVITQTSGQGALLLNKKDSFFGADVGYSMGISDVSTDNSYFAMAGTTDNEYVYGTKVADNTWTAAVGSYTNQSLYIRATGGGSTSSGLGVVSGDTDNSFNLYMGRNNNGDTWFSGRVIAFFAYNKYYSDITGLAAPGTLVTYYTSR